MSGLREYLDALGRMLGRGVRLRGEDPRLVGDEAPDEDPRLAERPGPGLLRFEQAMVAPMSAVGNPAVRRRVDGTFYDRGFTVWFPPGERQPAGHRWALACWTAEVSGTSRPEVLAVCVTCTEARGAGTVVGPASCVLRSAEVDAVYDDLADQAPGGLADLWPAPVLNGGVGVVPQPPTDGGHWAGSFNLGWTVCKCWVGRNHEPHPDPEGKGFRRHYPHPEPDGQDFRRQYLNDWTPDEGKG
jgi:hypothetical protein